MTLKSAVMEAQLRTLVMLLCIASGQGLWLRALSEKKPDVAPQPELLSRGAPAAAPQPELLSRGAPAAAPEALAGSSVPESPLLSLPLSAARSRRSPPDPPCAVRSVLIRVQDLGLGYDSDEEVLFKFCSGACPHRRSNHDLALSSLLQSGLLPTGHAALTGPWHYAPCCRPTYHEDVAFLDNNHRWHKVEALSAAACHCVG